MILSQLVTEAYATVLVPARIQDNYPRAVNYVLQIS
jgi:hypothetical protein